MVFLSENLAQNGGICPVCGKMVANGVGGENDPLTPLLHELPSSHLFYDSANLHDVFYHVGRSEIDRKNADKRFLEHMLDTVKTRCDSHKKPWFVLAAYRNYYCVRWFGKKFFSYQGCNSP